MVCGTEGTGEAEVGNSGIAAGHAYSLLQAREVRSGSKKYQLV
jgi:hypothetical protein